MVKRDKQVSFAQTDVNPPGYSRRKKLESDLEVGYSTSLVGYVGIRNLGATCYMASLLQTLYWTPEFRSHVLALNFDVKQRHLLNVAHQLQLFFARLGQSEIRTSVNPKDFSDSFGMGSQAQREQHDVHELNRVLLDVIQSFVDKLGAPQVLRYLYEGKMCDYRICQNCSNRREDSTVMYDVSLPLQTIDEQLAGTSNGPRITTVRDCFAAYVAAETIDGVQCDACKGKHPIRKGSLFAALPRVLMVQLLRMQYNMLTGQREKLTIDVELEATIDLAPYTTTPNRAAPFRLQSIICHRGSAYHGHYFALIADDNGQWLKFDDDVVTALTDADMKEFFKPAAWKTPVDEKKEIKPSDSALIVYSKPQNPLEGPVRDSSESMNREGNNNSTGDTGSKSAENFTPSENRETVEIKKDSVQPTAPDYADNLWLDSLTLPSPPLRTVSATPYYLVYRSMETPSGDVLPPSGPPADYLIAQMDEERREREGLQAELQTLLRQIYISLFIPFTNRKKWLTVEATTTMHELMMKVEEVLDEDEREALRLVTNFKDGEPMRNWRLRYYSTTLERLGASLAGSNMTECGFRFDTSVFPVLSIERLRDDAPLRGDGDWVRTYDWDATFRLRSAMDGFSSESVISSYANPTVDTFLLAVAEATPIPYDNIRLTIKRVDAGVVLDTSAPFVNCRDVGIYDGSVVYVESNTSSRLLAVETIEAASRVTVEYTLHESTGAPPSGLPSTMSARLNLTLDELKTELCARVGWLSAETQILIGNARREPHSMWSMISQYAVSLMSAPTTAPTLSVAVVHEPPVHASCVVADVWVASSPPRWSDLLRHGARIVVTPQTTRAEVFLAVGVLHTRARLRVMESGRRRSLGTPTNEETVVAALRQQHRQVGEVDLVVQSLAEPDNWSKGCILLHAHPWDPSATSVNDALGKGREVVVTRFATPSTLRECVAEFCGGDPSTILIALTKYYALQDVAEVPTKLRWGLWDDVSHAKSIISSYPFNVDMDDILLYLPRAIAIERRWNLTIPTRHQRRDTNSEAHEKKKLKAETGITMRAVWELDDPEPVESTTASADPSDEAAAPSSNPATGLHKCAYDAAVHGALGEECRICCASYTPGETIMVYPCHHMFHHQCALTWIESATSAPLKCPQCMQLPAW